MTAHNEAAAGLVELLTSRIGEEFDGECHLTEDEARKVIAALTQAEELRRERDGLRGIVSKMTNALPSGAYCSPEASLEFMEHLPDEVLLCTSRLVDRAAAAEALVAEGVKVCEPFAELLRPEDERFSGGTVVTVSFGNKGTTIEITMKMGDLRAARSFIQRAKESRT